MTQSYNYQRYIFKQLYLLFTLILILAGCSKKENCESDGPNQVSSLIVSPQKLELSGNGKGKLVLSTYPATKTHWKVLSDFDWVQFEPSEGDINMDMVEIEVTVNLDNVKEGYNSQSVDIMTNNIGKSNCMIYYYFDPDYISLTTNSEELVFDFFDNDRTFVINNDGLADIQWKLIDSIPYVTFDQADGFLAKGDSVKLTATLDRSLLASGTFSSSFQITANESDTIQVMVESKNYIEEKWLFDGQVIDAEYSREVDKIIIAIGEPTGIKILDPVLETEKFLSIQETPIAISVQPQGNKVVVACKNKIYSIDMATPTIVGSWNINFTPADVIYGDGEWAYLFYSSDNGYWNIYNLNLITGETHISSIGINDDFIYAQLHPSYKYLYASFNTYYNSLNYFKFDLTNDTTELMYVKPFPNNSYDKGFWITDDGLMAIINDRKVAHISSNEEQDFTYIGKLPTSEYDDVFISIDSYSELNRIATIIKEDWYLYEEPNKVTLYKKNTLQPEKTIQVPNYFLDIDTTGIIYSSVAQFVFFNSQGDKIYIILRAEESYPVYNDWSVFTYDLTGLKQ